MSTSNNQGPQSNPQAQAKIWQALDSVRDEADPQLTQRLFLELLAAQAIHWHNGVRMEEALNILSQELDISCLLLQPEHKHLRTVLCRFFDQLDADTFSADLVDAEEFLQHGQVARSESSIFIPPIWLRGSILRLMLGAEREPVLWLDWGSTTLIPSLWTYLSIIAAEIVTLDHEAAAVENLKLLTALVARDLEQVREAIHSYADWLPNESSWLDTVNNLLGSGQFGTIMVNLFASPYHNPRYRTDISQDLPLFLSQRLTLNGRAVLLGPMSLLDGMAYDKLRAALSDKLHVEAIVDLSTVKFPSNALWQPALILLRQPQQSITRRATILAPADPHIPLDEDEPLADLLEYLGEGDQQLQSETLFERPTVELVERWDPKFYSPARLQLQDNLINSAQASWLGSISQLIDQGTPPSFLKPYVKTKLAGVTHAGRQETIAYLKPGDVVRLRHEEDNAYDPNAVHVERRSGTSLGYLPAELAADVAEALLELGGTYQATVVKVQGGTTDAPNRGVTIQFAPPDLAKMGEPVSIIRPGDISSNRLTVSGELAWLLDEDQAKVTRLSGGDILLSLRVFGQACVVPRDLEGAVCHQDLAIIRPNDDIDPLYLLSFILSAEFQEQLQFVARGGPLPRIDVASLEELLVIVPTLDMQRRVALVFAESQGELGPGFKDNIERWLNLSESVDTIERQWIPSSLLSNLFSDWDRIHGFDDWLRLKHTYITDLRNSIAHKRFSFNDSSVDAAVMALGTFSFTVEQTGRSKENMSEARPAIEHELGEFQATSRQIQNSFLQRRFLRLADMLQELLHVRAISIPVQLDVEQNTLPVGVPALLRLTAQNQGEEALLNFEIRPALVQGEFIELPTWQIDRLNPGEPYTFEARLRFERPGSIALECVLVYTANHDEVVEQAVQLTLEAVPAELIPFEPIQPNPYITGGAVNTPVMFFGRQDVLDFLSTNLIGAHQSNVIILQGNRRTGKSSILKQIVNADLFAPHLPVYIDCQGLGALTDQRFFYKIAREICKVLRKQEGFEALPLVQRQQISKDDAFYDFRELLDEWSHLILERQIILLIDEFEVIDMAIQRGDLSATVLENLRHLFQHRHDLAVVLTGSYRLNRLRQDYWSILFGLGLKREVGFLAEPAARQLITQPLSDLVTYAPEAVHRVIELTACQPYFIQMICHNIVNVLNGYHTTYVTQLYVEEAVQETLVSADGHMRFIFDSVGSPAWQAILVYLASSLGNANTLPLYQLNQFIESNRLSVSNLDLEQALRDMSDRDIIQMAGPPDQRLYGFKIDLIRQWIRRNYDLQSAISLAQSTPYIREE